MSKALRMKAKRLGIITWRTLPLEDLVFWIEQAEMAQRSVERAAAEKAINKNSRLQDQRRKSHKGYSPSRRIS